MRTRTFINSAVLTVSLSLAFGFTFHQQPLNESSSGEELSSVDGDSLNMKKYEGKVVIMNFWASWSKTSRTENKNIARVYQKYKLNPKVVFVSVSLDTDKASWKGAIEEDELTWPDQVCDFSKWESGIAVKYHVTTLPKIILIDSKGVVSTSAGRMIDIESSIDALIK